MRQARMNHPSEVGSLGDRVKVVVLDFNEKKARISLGLKQATPDPWTSIEDEIPVGKEVQGSHQRPPP
jgi:small subunit ribosomal protein S1